ncbi:MAG: cyclodeaminase/cyclohydrolase family protein [Acidobacteria bacterium]|nr:cyclodeaminase/cyclohydrolase family protein [Acidobacteriota bacterium]MCA1611889.1 cyclodeaminase/cyclohydrolase family protein [Acidobacteriota bacterium]
MTEFAKLTVIEFIDALGSDAPTPGGGTAAAIAGAMGASLMEMVAALTLTRDKYVGSHAAVRPIAQTAASARLEFLKLAREDSEAYELVVAARRLGKDTDSQKTARADALAIANRRATEVPMRTAQLAARVLASLPELVEKGNPSAASDAGSAALLLEAAAEGALLNVGVNLSGISDPAFVAKMQRETAQIQNDAQRLRAHILASVRKRF